MERRFAHKVSKRVKRKSPKNIKQQVSKKRKTNTKKRKRGKSRKRSTRKSKKGGAIRLPGEFFGRNSNRYTNANKNSHKGTSFPGTNLSYTI